jgi:hypothetical protein
VLTTQVKSDVLAVVRDTPLSYGTSPNHQDTGDIAALHMVRDGGMRLQVLHPCAAEIMDRCVISAMILLKTFSKHRRRTGLDSPEDLW